MSEIKNNRLEFRADKIKTYVGAPDKTLFTIVLFLVIIGLMAIFSAGAPRCIAAGTNPAGFAIKQIFAIIIGFVGMNYLSRKDFNYKKLAGVAMPVALFVIFALMIVNYTPLGVEVYGAKRWINLGFAQFQPSEMAKFAVILLLANAYCKDARFFVKEKFVRYYLPILVMLILVFGQPNLSMVLLLLAISAIMYISAGGSATFILSVVALGGFVLSKVIKSYQLSRIKIWLNPEIDPYGAGYNIIQSLLAFAAGGFLGEGYGNSKQKLAWLPEAHTDFIFAVIGEEMGFVGCAFVVGIFAAFIHRGLIISSRCEDMFGKLLAVGITLSIGAQAFINMAVSSSMIPATGVPLPFISYGGTSIIVSLCMVGVLLNISRKRIKKISYYDSRKNN